VLQASLGAQGRSSERFGLQGRQRLASRSFHWIVPEPLSLLGALARLGLMRTENGVAPLCADAIQAHYVRDEVAMDLSAQRAYRRSRSLATGT